MNSMLIGLFGHFILFGVGYLTSRVFGGYRPANVEELTIHQVRKLRRDEAEKAQKT